MKINKAWCFFEQTGTFKNEFMKLGIPAVDCDILNHFNQTDYQIDLFDEIQKAYTGKMSIFYHISTNDLIFAFFPCTRFSCRVQLNARCEMPQSRNWDNSKKLDYSRDIVNGISKNYDLLCKLCMVALSYRFRLIVENPYTQPHFLTQYFPLKPSIIDVDRSMRGDVYKKPTKYYFINCSPEHNFCFENIENEVKRTVEKVISDETMTREEMRNYISPVYANRFIREFILDEEKENDKDLSL